MEIQINLTTSYLSGGPRQSKSQSRFASAETKISRFVSLQEFHIERVYCPCAAGSGGLMFYDSHISVSEFH